MHRRHGFTIHGTVLIAALGLLAVAPAQSANITVTTNVDELNSDKDCSLREAIQAANTDTAIDYCTAGSGDDTITIPAATYSLSIAGSGEDLNATGDLDIRDNLTLNGAGQGATIIDGQGIDRVLHLPEVVTVSLNDLTIIGGRAPDNTSGGWGGSGGGIAALNDSTLEITRCTIEKNFAGDGDLGGGYGGGISISGTLTMTDCTVSDNNAGNGNDGAAGANGRLGGEGGGISASSFAVVTLTRCQLTGNASGDGGNGGTGDTDGSNSGRGGGIAVGGDSTLTITDCWIDGNSTGAAGASSGSGSDGYRANGGGVACENTDTTISGSTVSNNNAGSSGALYFVDMDPENYTVINSTLSGNSADGFGGGIYVSSLTVVNLINCTVTDNQTLATNAGGGLYVSSGTLNVQNTIVADNSSADGPDCFGTVTSLDFNIIGDTQGCTFSAQSNDQTDTDPLLGSLADNGGSTRTHALQAGSPAIDQIPDGVSGCSAGVSRDQRFFVRAGGSGLGGSACDVGAYESSSDVPVTLQSFEVQ